MIDAALLDEFLSGQLDLLRLEASTRVRVLRLLDQLERELRSKLSSDTLTDMGKSRLSTLLRQTSSVIDDYYERMAAEADKALLGTAEYIAKDVHKSIQGVFSVELGAYLPTEAYLKRVSANTLVFGSPSANWWSRQSADTAFRFANAVRLGATAGETNDQIVRRVLGSPKAGTEGIMQASRANARSLVHAAIQSVANDARMETFRKNSDVIKGVRQVSTFDSHTTEICIGYSNQEWDLITEKPLKGSYLPFVSDGGSPNGVPRHWGCRSVLVPITKTFKELGLDMPEFPTGTRASNSGQIAADTTFAAFLERKGEAYQNATLGKGRAELWRSKKITLNQLLDLRGNPLTVAQLKARYS